MNIIEIILIAVMSITVLYVILTKRPSASFEVTQNNFENLVSELVVLRNVMSISRRRKCGFAPVVVLPFQFYGKKNATCDDLGENNV